MLIGSQLGFIAGTIVPTTWNPSDVSAGITLSNGNLTATATTNASGKYLRSIAKLSAKKYYFELTLTTFNPANNDYYIGIADSSASGGSVTGGVLIVCSDGNIIDSSGNNAYSTAIAAGAIIMVAVDNSAGKVWFGKNGTWLVSGNPSTGSNPSSTHLAASPAYAYISPSANSSVSTVNFGATAYSYSPPTGFGNL